MNACLITCRINSDSQQQGMSGADIIASYANALTNHASIVRHAPILDLGYIVLCSRGYKTDELGQSRQQCTILWETRYPMVAHVYVPGQGTVKDGAEALHLKVIKHYRKDGSVHD